MNWSDSVIIADYEKHWGFPSGSLTSGNISHISSESNTAIWTRYGGVVACADSSLADAIIEIVNHRKSDEPSSIFSALSEIVSAVIPHVSCSMDICLSTETHPRTEPAGSLQVEELCQKDLWPDDDEDPDIKHIFGIRIGDTIVARATDRISLIADGRRFYAVGAGTHPDHQGKGLATAVVSAMVESIVSEGGVALWNCDVTNIASFRLALKVGFVENLWYFRWSSV